MNLKALPKFWQSVCLSTTVSQTCVADVWSVLQLGRMRRSSISLAQRRRAQEILIEHETFTSRLEQTRQAILQDMSNVIEAEAQAQGPLLLPSRIIKLSEHVCPVSFPSSIHQNLSILHGIMQQGHEVR